MHNLLDFSCWSLRRKLVFIIMLSSFVCLFISLSVLVTSSVISRHKDSIQEFSSLADVLAENGQAALMFSDHIEAERLLKSLESHHEISSAWLVTADGTVLSSWSRNGAAGGAPADYRVTSRQTHSDFWSRHAHLYSPIARGNEPIGYVLLQADFTEQWNNQMADLANALGGGAVALLVVFMLAIRLQRVISRPIEGIADAARAIAHDKTYELRVPQRTHDEIGDLIMAFNGMLDEIQVRDEHLIHHQNVLEEKVEKRTTELEHARERAESANCKLAEQNAQLANINHELEFAQIRLRINETRLQAILDNSPIGIWLVGVDGRYHFVNKTFCNAIGVAESEFLTTHHLADIMEPEAAASCLKSDRECLEQDEPHLSHEILTFVDGKQHLVEVTKVKLHDDTGRVTDIVGTAIDITEQREREQALEAASRIKSEFLANMSHEIRTPMNSILGMAHLALNAETDPKNRDYLEKIHLSGLHLLGIIDEILDFSKIDAGKLKIEMVDFDLGLVLNNFNNMIAEKAAEKGLQLDFDIDPGIQHTLHGDPRRLSQVLINYASNAIKFTATGNIIIRAKKIEEDENSTLVRFEVQDTGIGICDEDKARLFQPFQQVDASATRNYGGTGLGLAISKQLVAMMEEGEVGVDSIPGQGSTFWFTVRLGKGSKPHDSGGESETCFPPNLFNGVRILLAEDNLFNQQVATEFLEDVGATVCVANNGKEAMDLLIKDHFDCVLMDIQMPLIGGFEATRLIRANPELAGMTVIAMTANASGEDRARCLAAGMDDYISKPFKPNMLYTTLAKWLSVQPQQMPFFDMSSTLPSATTWAGDPNVIDLSVLAELIGDNNAEMRKFILRFLASARKDMAEIESALERGDLMALRALGHHNKSPARMVGAMGFANLCQALEGHGKNEMNIMQAQGIVSQMRPLLDRINEQVDKDLA